MSDTRTRPNGASGRFVLRITPALHAQLRNAAKGSAVSLNDYCARKLADPVGAGATSPDAARAVERAAEIVGDHLIGVAVFGSWSRGEASSGSDVDLLIVVDAKTPIARRLYSAWDKEPLRWETMPVEPHFVHLPGPDQSPGGLWAEVAIDGMVIFEKARRLSMALARVRGEIAAGRIVRRAVHGQSYWAEVD